MIISEDIVNSFATWDGISDNFVGNIIPVPALDFRIAGYKDGVGTIHILLEKNSSDFETEIRRGMKVEYRELDIVGEGQIGVLDFQCLSLGFKNNFITIVSEIIDGVIDGEELDNKAKSVIDKWFYFLQLPITGAMDIQNIYGLLGELLSVEQFILESNDIHKCLEAWKGPLGSKRDFMFERIEVEVKASGKHSGHIHTISGIDQLSRLGEEEVFVYSWNILQDHSEASFTLNAVIDRLIDEYFSAEEIKEYFLEKIYKYGYDVRDKAVYDRLGFRVKSSFLSHVDSNFPSLSSNSFNPVMNPRIIGITYDIDLNGIEQIEISRVI